MGRTWKMRTIARALWASCLLLGFSHPATAADKIKIEIVETTMTIGLVPYTSPGTPEQIRTHCDARVDVNCVSTVTPATEPTSYTTPQILAYEIKAILPDGSHAHLMCFPSRLNKKCKGIESSVSSGSDASKCFMEAIAAFASNHENTKETKACTTKNLGVFSAKRDKDEIVISAHNGKVEYRVTGLW
jgi:hypothetical protein